MKHLVTILVAAAFTSACAVGVDSTAQPEDGTETIDATAADDPGAEAPGVAFESAGETSPTGPGSCIGQSSSVDEPGFAAIPTECLQGFKYYDVGDPWTPRDAELPSDAELEPTM